jgi:replicative DNA helicase
MGVGKSWRLIEHAIAAAENGWNVVFFGLEMKEADIMDRMHRVGLRKWKGRWDELPIKNRTMMFNEWKEEHNSKITIHAKDLKKRTPAMLESNSQEKSLYIIDHIGLMSNAEGKRSISDWSIAAAISNELKEKAITLDIPILAAAQINRAGSNTAIVPGVEHLAQSDALGQDADAVITLSKSSTRVTVNSMAKYRHGESGRKWFTMFDPQNGDFESIDPKHALELKYEDETIEAEFA